MRERTAALSAHCLASPAEPVVVYVMKSPADLAGGTGFPVAGTVGADEAGRPLRLDR